MNKKSGRDQLIQTYKQSQILSNWLWMSILSGDEDMLQQDIEWAKKISLQIAEGLFGYAGMEKSKMAKALIHKERNAPPRARERRPAARIHTKAVIAEDIKTGQTLEFGSGKAAAEKLGIHRSSISQAVNGKAKSAKGYRFRFAK